MTESQYSERARRSGYSNPRRRIIAAVVGVGVLLLVAALLTPQTCAPTIQLQDGSGQCGYPDYGPAVAVVALVVVVIGGLIAGLSSAERRFPLSFRIGLAIATAGALLGAAMIAYLAFHAPLGALL